MADSVGQIGLDLVVNKNDFNKQMAGIQGIAAKAGKTLAAAFAVKKIIDFGKSAIELGSDLTEVQNVVDVTFPKMSKQIDAFAKNAALSFGLSETMAKKFTGTFGAMAKAFGFSESAAYDMSTTLTGLAGDVASFYNLSQDEAYTKLKSVFTGETETLKDLGIVMTQNALDAYAMANGYGKVTAKMSEAEKVALRYQFVQDQLALATGDFSRTSNQWANQVRILTLQFDSLKATIGQGLINVLTPVIQVINTIIGKLMSLANAFKSFTELITGKKGSDGGVSATAAGMEAVAGAADNATGAVGAVGDAAKKAGKKVKDSLSNIDKLNVITTSDSGSGSEGSGGYAADSFDMGQLDNSGVEEASNKYQILIDKARELANLFKGGFNIAFGDTSVMDSIQQSVQGIGKSLKDIFTDPAVLAAAEDLGNRIALNLGKAAGSIASVGATIADNLLGGINLYLEQNNQQIKDYLVSMFDISGQIADIVGNFNVAFATVFSAFRSDSAKQITADIIGIFSSAFMGVTELAGKFGRDILDMITAPFIQNKDLIKQALEDTFTAVEPIFSELKSIADEAFTKINETYDAHIKPMLDSFKQGFTEIATKFLEVYNTYFLPVITQLSDQFGKFREEYLSPLIDKFLELGGKVADAISVLWENILKPFILWFMDAAAPVIAKFVSDVIDRFFQFLGGVSKVVEDILTALGGLIDFIIGVFTGDWDRAWEGIKTFFTSTWDSIKDAVSLVINTIASIIKTVVEAIKAEWELKWNLVKSAAEDIWTAIETRITETIGKIKDGITNKLTEIKAKWEEIWNGVKTTTVNIFDAIWNAIKISINYIIGGVEKMANGVIKSVNKIADAISGFKIDIPDKIAAAVGFDSFGFDIPHINEVSIPRLAQGGFVKANTPQLAMIGDNTRYGEVVAPENKLQELLDKAVQGRGNDIATVEMLMLLREMKALLKIISEKNPQAMQTAKEMFDTMRSLNDEYMSKYGVSAFT